MPNPASTPELTQHLEVLNEHVKALARYAPKLAPQRPGSAPKPLDCPQCGSPMQPGQVRLHGDCGTLFMFGFGLEHGWFQPDSAGKEEKVLHTTKPRRALKCANCQTVVILGTDPVS
jgi:hypothetical protein